MSVQLKYIGMFKEIYNETNNDPVHLAIACNALFVACDVRPAFFFAYHYFAETQEDLKNITNLKLKEQRIISILEKYLVANKTSCGIFVAKKLLTTYFLEDCIAKKDRIMTNKIVGVILGYPCVGDLDFVERRKYLYKVFVKNNKNNQQDCVFAVICRQDTDQWFQQKVIEMKEVLQKYIPIYDFDTFYAKDNVTYHPPTCKIVRYAHSQSFPSRTVSFEQSTKGEAVSKENSTLSLC